MTFLKDGPNTRIPERQFMAQVVQLAQMLGWTAYHTHRSDKSAPGFPDLVLVRRPRVIWAELKAERGRMTQDQLWWLCELRSCGQEAYVFRPSDWPKIERIFKGRPDARSWSLPW